MARVKNDLLKLSGSFGGFTFYQDEKGTVVKQKATVYKKRIMTHPNSKRTRENMKEMGVASQAAKLLRLNLHEHHNKMGDRYLSGRLSGLFRKVVGLGSGIPGERILDFRANGAILEGFEFVKARPLQESIGGIIEKPTASINRNEIYWTSPTLNRKKQITAPIEATHCKFILGAAAVPNFKYNSTQKKYVCLETKQDYLGGYTFSEPIALSQKTIAPTLLTVTLTTEKLLDNIAVVTLVGIVFYKEVNGEMVKIDGVGGLKVLGVI